MLNRLFLAASVLALILLAVTLWQQASPQWASYQKAYWREYASKAEKPELASMPIEIKQVWDSGLDIADRCTTCHMGVENALFKEAPQPLRTHPGELLKKHPPDKFGCTVCHEGQGYALKTQDAHGYVKHWERPLLGSDEIQSSCGKCHYESELFGAGSAEADVMGREVFGRELRETELRTTLPGADWLAWGKSLIRTKGCLGCHKYRGKGGVLGPDITYVGDKTDHDFDFTRVKGEHTVANWLFQHFKLPRKISPDTIMPDLGLSDEEAKALTITVMSFKRKRYPAKFTAAPKAVKNGSPTSGETLYGVFCSACHGKEGTGSQVPGIAGPSLNNPDFLAIADATYLHNITALGRVGTNMIPWREKGGLESEEIRRLASFIKSWRGEPVERNLLSPAKGNARVGRKLFTNLCAGCHGLNAEGGIGTALNNREFLSVVSDEFLINSIVNGRGGTAMPSWRHLPPRDINDLLAYIRSFNSPAPDKEAILSAKGSKRIGAKIYRARCSFCHGRKGEGAIGTALKNQDFLTAADRSFLYDTIVRGRPGTAMPAWRQLAPEDIIDLLAFIDSWREEPRKALPRRVIAGDADYGRILYGDFCSSCHGAEGEGGVGPQLRNPVFLETASDAFMRATIERGRSGTAMRPFGRGEGSLVELTPFQVDSIIAYFRSWQAEGGQVPQRFVFGFPERGLHTYKKVCSQCHGEVGQGKTGPAHNNADFLAAASDGFLQATMVMGRLGTEMRAVARGSHGNVQLSVEEINDVVSFIRSWETYPTPPEDLRRFLSKGDFEQGRRLYKGLCSSCHGTDGKGALGPSLNNPSFLKAVSDGFLQAIIVRGRQGTPMTPFGLGSQGIAQLTEKEINNIIYFIRHWEEETPPKPKVAEHRASVPRTD